MKNLKIEWTNEDFGICMYWVDSPRTLRAFIRWEDTPLADASEDTPEYDDPFGAAGMPQDYGYITLKRAIAEALRSAGIHAAIEWPYLNDVGSTDDIGMTDDFPSDADADVEVTVELYAEELLALLGED